MATYFFLLAFSAALVAFPATSLGVVACKEILFKKNSNTQQGKIDHLDDTDSNGLPHVPDGEPSKGRELGEGLDAHGLAGEQLDNSGITRLDELGVVLGRLTSTTINLLLDLSELEIKC